MTFSKEAIRGIISRWRIRRRINRLRREAAVIRMELRNRTEKGQ